MTDASAPQSPQSNIDLEVLAAQLRRHADDLSLYGAMLLNVLSAALPAEVVEVRREGRWRARLSGREPAVLGISVTVGRQRFDLDRPAVGAPTATKVCHQSGGVIMSTVPLAVDEWCRQLAGALAAVAGANEAAIVALQRLAGP
jgi:hypothetical protein